MAQERFISYDAIDDINQAVADIEGKADRAVAQRKMQIIGDGVVEGYFLRATTGAPTEHASYCYQFFDISAASRDLLISANIVGSATALAVFYDAGGSFLSYEVLGETLGVTYTDEPIKAPDDAAKVGLCSRIDALDDSIMRVISIEDWVGLAEKTYALDRFARHHAWALTGATGPDGAVRVMDTPPNVTVNETTISTMSGSSFIDPDSARVSKRGGEWGVASDAADYRVVNRSGGRVVFDFYGSEFEVKCRQNVYPENLFSMRLDGEEISVEKFWGDLRVKSDNLVHIDFGANTETFPVIDVEVATAGTGYAIGDTITLADAIELTVHAVSSGGVAYAGITNVGTSSAYGSNPMAQVSTSGSGTGAEFTIVWGRGQTTQKPRRIEITFARRAYYGGLYIPSGGSVAAVPESGQAKLMIVGDSITDYAFSDYAGGIWADQVADGFGLKDRYVRFATAGRGWIRAGTNFIEDDFDDLITQEPDMLVIALGTNDFLTSQDTDDLRDGIARAINQIHSALPECLVVALTGWESDTTYDATVVAGVAKVTDQDRVRAVELRNKSLSLSQKTGWQSSDGTHPHQIGHDAMARTVGPLIAEAFREMIAAVV